MHTLGACSHHPAQPAALVAGGWLARHHAHVGLGAFSLLPSSSLAPAVLQVAYGWLARQHAHAGLGGAALARRRMGLTELQATFSAPAPLPAHEAGMTLSKSLILRFLS